MRGSLTGAPAELRESGKRGEKVVDEGSGETPLEIPFKLSNLLAEPLPPDIPIPKFWKGVPENQRRAGIDRLSDSLLFHSVNLLARFLRLFKISRGARLASFVGRIAYHVLRPIRKRALENLVLCMGSETTEKERRRIVKNLFVNSAVSCVEVVWMGQWKDLFDWLEIEIDGIENMAAALAARRGVIALSGHFGNWEVFASANARMGMPAAVVAREQREPRLEDWILQIRQSGGLKVITRGKNPIQMIRWLKGGKLLAILFDLDTRSNEGVFVDFFGKPTYTQVGPFVLARHTDALLIPVLCYREGLNRLRFHYGAPWEMARTDDAVRDIRDAAQKANAYLEERIRERPEQWAWFHKRWKTTPKKIKIKKRKRAYVDGLEDPTE
jgi:KDO2-lipid IV(A) lauroyltransferase